MPAIPTRESVQTAFDRLLSGIDEPALRDVASHWKAACRNRPMPGWSDIDPLALKRHLPIIWAWRYDFALDTFIGRLAGEDINFVVGQDIRGRRLEDCFPSHAASAVASRCKSVIDVPQFMHSKGPVYLRLGHPGSGERIILPLAADGIRADGIIGATVYKLGSATTMADGPAIDYLNEKLAFFPLG